jgi:hypothetical protein
MAMFGQDGFGVELYPFNIEFGVPNAHDFAIFRPRRDFETRRASGPLNGQ